MILTVYGGRKTFKGANWNMGLGMFPLKLIMTFLSIPRKPDR